MAKAKTKSKGKAQPTKTTTSKPPKAVRDSKGNVAKPPKRRGSARQQPLPAVTRDGTIGDLEDLVTEAYDATSTWKAAHAPMQQARAKLQEAMRTRGLEVYTTETGVTARLKRKAEKLELSSNSGQGRGRR